MDGLANGKPKGLVRRAGWGAADTLAMTRRNLLHYLRVPEALFFATAQPVMLVLLFTFVFGGAIVTPGVGYVDYLLPGVLVQAVLFGASGTTVGLADDLSRGMVDRFRSLPMARGALLAGRTLADALRNLLVVLLMVAVGVAVGFRFAGGLPAAVGAVALVVLFGFACSWVGVAIALVVKDAEAAPAAGFVWIFPLLFASSAFVPVRTMPAWLRAFAEAQPVSAAVNGARYLTSGGAAPGTGPGDVAASLVWTVAILALAVPLAVLRYRRPA